MQPGELGIFEKNITLIFVNNSLEKASSVILSLFSPVFEMILRRDNQTQIKMVVTITCWQRISKLMESS